MRCPKCSHIQAEAPECRKCGVIFTKYEAYEQRKKELTEKTEGRLVAKKSSLWRSLQLALLLCLVASVTYYFTAKQHQPLVADDQTGIIEKGEVVKTRDPLVREKSGETSGVERKVTAPAKTGSVIERARRATVSIETPWGAGSGFFIDKNYIVTNKHVVEFDIKSLDDFRERVRTNRKLLNLEEEKLQDLKKRMDEMVEGPTKSQLKIILKQRRKYLAQVKKDQRENEKRLAKLEQEATSPEIKIFLHDGSEHSIGYMMTSQEYDLALLSLHSHDGVSLKRPPDGLVINQGDKVYTVGSPVGLRQTVTAGIFSGFRKREADDHLFLQTDAAINPGNSGGPLIDEHGYVRGVNTMIMKNTEGIGFAIPIKKVFEEFNTILE